MTRPSKPTRAELISRLTAAAAPLNDNDLARLVENAETVEDRADAADLLTRCRDGDPVARSTVLTAASARLNLARRITGVIKVTSNPEQYYLTIADPDTTDLHRAGTASTRLHLGGIDVLDNQTETRRAFLASLGWGPHRGKTTEWDTTVNQLLACADTEAPDEAMTDAGRATRWVRKYLGPGPFTDLPRLAPPKKSATAEDTDQARTVSSAEMPFRDADGVHLFLESLRKHIRDDSHGGESPTAAELGRCLAAAGCERRATKFPKPDSDGETTRSTWLVPAEIAK